MLDYSQWSSINITIDSSYDNNGCAIDDGAIYNLYRFAGFLAVVFAGSRFSVAGLAAAIVPIFADIVDDFGLEALSWIRILAGIFLALFGLLKIGDFIK